MKILYFKQEKPHTCGAAALRTVLNSSGFNLSEEEVAKMLGTNEIRGTWTKSFAKVANKLNLAYTSKDNSSIREIRELTNYYLIIVCFHTSDNDDHYTVIKNIDEQFIYFSDSWYGPDFKMSLADFERRWKCNPRFEKIERWFFAIEKR